MAQPATAGHWTDQYVAEERRRNRKVVRLTRPGALGGAVGGAAEVAGDEKRSAGAGN